jgi:hypothetical protein
VSPIDIITRTRIWRLNETGGVTVAEVDMTAQQQDRLTLVASQPSVSFKNHKNIEKAADQPEAARP